jgi:hypothetical protein
MGKIENTSAKKHTLRNLPYVSPKTANRREVNLIGEELRDIGIDLKGPFSNGLVLARKIEDLIRHNKIDIDVLSGKILEYMDRQLGPELTLDEVTLSNRLISMLAKNAFDSEDWTLLKQSFSADFEKTGSLKDYAMFRILAKMDPQLKDELAKRVINILNAQGSTALDYHFPGSKLALSKEADQLDDISTVANIRRYTARHLLVLGELVVKSQGSLMPPSIQNYGHFASTPISEPKAKLNRAEPKKDEDALGSVMPSIPLPSARPRVRLREVSWNNLTFKVDLRLLQNQKVFDELLLEVGGHIEEFNRDLLSDHPLTDISLLLKGDSSAYFPYLHRVELIAGTSYYMGSLTHELGHGYYEKKGLKTDDDWQDIGLLSMGFRGYEMVDDSNTQRHNDLMGHPFDNPDELFASAFQAYRLFPERLVSFIEDSDTSPEQKVVGKQMYLYMRDNVFEGKTFFKPGVSQPYAKEDLALIGTQQLEDATRSAFQNPESYPGLSVHLENMNPARLRVAAMLLSKLPETAQQSFLSYLGDQFNKTTAILNPWVDRMLVAFIQYSHGDLNEQATTLHDSIAIQLKQFNDNFNKEVPVQPVVDTPKEPDRED